MKKLAALFCLLSLVVLADGNDPTNTPGATPVSVVSSQAATICVESTVAAGSQPVVTVPACTGTLPYFYITNVSSILNAIAAPSATLVPTTTSNVPGGYSIRQAMQAAVGTSLYQESFPGGLKTIAPNTATVFTGTLLASVSMSLRVCGFCAK